MNWKLFRLKVLMEGGNGGQGNGGEGGGGGEQTPEWVKSLPESVQGWDEVKNSDSPEKFWDQMTNMRSFIGQSIRIPTDEAGEVAKQEFHKKLMEKVPGLMPTPNADDEEGTLTVLRKLGFPEKADEYELPEFDEKKFNKEYAEKFKGIAHKHGLTKKQFKNVLKSMYDIEAENMQNADTQRAQKFTELSTEWGAAFNERMSLIQSLAEKTQAPAEFMSALKNNLVAPGTLKWLFGLTEAIGGSEGLNLLDSGKSTGIMTPAEAQGLISDIMNNQQHPYWLAGHPDHAKALTRMIELRKLADPQADTEINSLKAGMTA